MAIRATELLKISDDRRIEAAIQLADAATHSLTVNGIDMTERQCLELSATFKRIAQYLEIASLSRTKDDPA